jgi:hypothetical protein
MESRGGAGAGFDRIKMQHLTTKSQSRLSQWWVDGESRKPESRMKQLCACVCAEQSRKEKWMIKLGAEEQVR